MSEPFVGEIRLWPTDYAPRNWAYCDGQTIPIAQNSILFAVIMDIYGGNGQTTMQLPNLMGRSVMGPGQGPGLTLRRLSERLGYPVMNVTTDELPQHRHVANAAIGFGTETSGAGQFNVARYDESTGSVLLSYKTEGAGEMDKAAGETLASTGSGTAHENRQPYLALSYCIAMEGVFPPHP